MKEKKYLTVCSILKSEISSGKYDSHGNFPSVVSTIRRFGISRLTAVKVFDVLKSEGLIYSRGGSGTFVTKQDVSRKIGLIMPGLAVSEFFHPIATTLIHLANSHGYTLLLGQTFSPDLLTRVKEAKELAAEMIRNHVAGVIYQPFETAPSDSETNQRILRLLKAKHIPVVLLDRDLVLPPARSDYDLVSINNVDACDRLTQHMVEAGAKNICFISDCHEVPNVENRIRGFLSAKARLESKKVHFEVIRGSTGDVPRIGRIMKRRLRPDAFVCDSDTMAAVLLQSLGALGYKVPDEVMIAGFDDVRLATLMTPPLTTIHQPCEEISLQAFNRLVARIADPKSAPMEILLPAPLVVRASTCRGKSFSKHEKAKQPFA